MTDTCLFEPSKIHGNFAFEYSLYELGHTIVAGTDEVGRGPLAGPVIAACVVLPFDCDHSLFKDSKVLSHSKRHHLLKVLTEINAHIGIGLVSESIIDEINILQASLLAMRQAYDNLCQRNIVPDFLLVDGTFKIPLDINQISLIKGESKSASIAAASIAAKVTRDQYMLNLHQQYPQYGFNTNSGYPTKQHRQALKEFGPCPHHRKTFKGVL